MVWRPTHFNSGDVVLKGDREGGEGVFGGLCCTTSMGDEEGFGRKRRDEEAGRLCP